MDIESAEQVKTKTKVSPWSQVLQLPTWTLRQRRLITLQIDLERYQTTIQKDLPGIYALRRGSVQQNSGFHQLFRDLVKYELRYTQLYNQGSVDEVLLSPPYSILETLQTLERQVMRFQAGRPAVNRNHQGHCRQIVSP